MTFKTILTAAAMAALLPAGYALAEDAQFMIEDAFARSSGPDAPAGAAFFTLHNMGDTDDTLISATSDVAQRVELHTHIEDTQGLLRMVEVEDGFPIAAGETLALERGGQHIMFMGLNQSFEQGDEIEVTLTFENAEPMTVTIPVDLERTGGHGGHGSHDHNHDHNHDHGSDG